MSIVSHVGSVTPVQLALRVRRLERAEIAPRCPKSLEIENVDCVFWPTAIALHNERADTAAFPEQVPDDDNLSAAMPNARQRMLSSAARYCASTQRSPHHTR